MTSWICGRIFVLWCGASCWPALLHTVGRTAVRRVVTTGACVQMRLLVENAELQERERESTTHEREDDDDAWGAWPWKRAPPPTRHSSPGKTAAAAP